MKKLDNTIIIGIGNNTRQDDGLGWCFIDLLETNGFNSNNLLCKYQLMVEDAEVIKKYKTVIFVDATKEELHDGFSIERIYPANEVAFSTHAVPPNQILNLCESIYNKTPKAFVVKMKGYNWDIEIGLSPKAQENLDNSYQGFLNKFNAF